MRSADKLRVVSWSSGKDSTATIVLAHEHGIPIDLIIISLMWFDKERRIYAEYPEVVEWIFNHAIPLFESWGYKVKVLTSERDYVYYFNHIIENSDHPERNGKKAAFLMGGKCYMNREKVNPIRKYLRELKRDYELYVGIAIDEPDRLERAHRKGQISLLEKFNVKESGTYEILKPYSLLSPTYKFAKRGGCWFCPNQGIKELARLKVKHPQLWAELEIFAKSENKVSEAFRYNKTFWEINGEVDEYIAHPPPEQLSLFDIWEEVLI